MNTFISPNSLVVSVLLNPSGGNTLASTIFPTQQELQNRKIIAIETFCNLDIQNDPLNPGIGVVPYAIFRNAFLTLYTSMPPTNPAAKPSMQQPGLFYDKVPFASLRRVQNNDTSLTPLPSFSRDIFRIRPTELAFNKCKIEFPTSVTQAAQYSAVFVFHYLDIDDTGAAYMV